MKVYLLGRGWNGGTVLTFESLPEEIKISVSFSTLFHRRLAWDPSVSKEQFHDEIYVKAGYTHLGMPAYKYSTTVLNSDIYVRE